MRIQLWCTRLVLAAMIVACGDQPTEVVPKTIWLATSTSDDGLSITTDKDDYAPGDTVWFTGAGWRAGDTLDIVLTDDPLTHDPHTWAVNVGADGMFHDSTYVVDEGDLDVKFTLVATSRATGRSLTVQFTDGVTKITGSPLGLTFNVPWVIHTNLTCTNPRTTNNSSGTATLTPNKTIDNAGNAGATESQRLTAPPTTAEGGAFKHWIRDDNTTTTTNPLCVPGVGGGGTPTYTAVYSAADLTIDKSHSGDFTRGSIGIYTLSVGNSGDAATNGTITVTDPLPAGLTFGSFTGSGWSCAAAGAAPVTVTCTRTVAIAAGGAAPVINLTVGVGGGTASSITNTVTVAGGGEPAGNNGNNTDSDQTTVVNPVDLAIDKAHSAGFTHGSNGVFTLTARNDGGTPTTGTVTVSDQLPAGYGYVSAVGTGWTCGTSGSPVTVTCTRTLAIAAGGSAPPITLTVSVSAAAGTTVSNTASVSGGNEPAANNGNNSDQDDVTISAPPNAAPVAVNDLATTNEDASVEIDVLANDTDDGPAANLTVVDLTQPAAGTGSVALSSGDKKVTYTPAADFFGTATFTYKVNDGTLNSATAATVTVTVNPVNDAPTFTKGANQTVLEDAGAQSVPGWATAISTGPSNESGQTVTFNVTGNTNTALFSAAPAISSTGTLTYTPAANANGVATITIELQDNGGTANGGDDTSTPQSFTITVTPVNDAPSFTKGANQIVFEDAGAQSVPGWATAISAGPSNESGQTVTFNVTGNTNTALFSAGPAISSTGTLTYTPAANANGVATITIDLQDNGGTANGGDDTSDPQSFTITVTPVNDAPSFTKGGDKTVNEGDPAQSFPNWATAMSAGPADESSQTLTFSVTNTNNALFSVQPAVSSTGELTFTPSAGPNGTATVTVRLTDNGGTANGGVDYSEQTFSITVNNVPPSILTLTLPIAPIQVGTPVNLSATFSDPGTADVHTAVIDWEDGTSSGTVTEGTQAVSGSHTYSAAGIYTVTLTVSDEAASDTEVFMYVVVYDPSAGFVTGGGWIMSPAGAYAADLTLTGKATFGFVSKYIFQKDKTTPVLTGNTEFQFHAGNLNFSSTSYQWLVVSGTSKATYKGSGTVNGVPGYGFLLSAIDGSPDKFRIKIWQTGGTVIYDNLVGEADDADPTTSITGGSIVIHVPKKTT